MATVKIAVTLDQDVVARLDQLVEERKFPNRSRAVQEAVREKLARHEQSPRANAQNFNPAFEEGPGQKGVG